MSLTKKKMVELYTTMLRIRSFEEKIEELVMTAMIGGFVHLYVGQEAVATGVCATLTDADYITSTHRGHGHLIAKGGDVKLMMAELFAKRTGYCKGKGGSMHIADLDLGILGANGIVGGGPPIAVGAAMAARYKGTDGVCVCFSGDGASNQGTTHEAMNLAAVWKAPVVFVAENNHYGEFTSQDRHQCIESITERAAGYGMPGVIVDGNDLAAVYEAAAEQEELQGAIEIGLLRGIADRMETQVRETKKQTVLMEEMVETGRRAAPDLNIDDLERAYLRGLYAECNDLPLAGKPPDVGGRHPRMQRVYVDLTTNQAATVDTVFDRLKAPQTERTKLLEVLREMAADTQHARQDDTFLPVRGMLAEQLVAPQRAEKVNWEFEDHPLAALAGDEETLKKALSTKLTALEAIQLHRQLVILGDPGSGKSTLTKRISGVLAAHKLPDLDDESRDWQTQVGDAFGRWFLPMRVVLSRWAQDLPEAPKVDDLIDYAVGLIEEVGSAPDGRMKDRILARMAGEQPTLLLLLDGLDEVADPVQRQRVQAVITDFKRCYPDVPLVITCRVRPYEEDRESEKDQAYLLPFEDVLLMPLDGEAQETFIRRWHDELLWAGLYKPEAAILAQKRLIGALRDEKRKELRDMAGTPLLLTMMARVNYKRGLPDERAVLYDEFIKQMLWEWERLKLDDQGQATSLELLLQEADVPKTSLERALSQLAYEIHGSQGTRDTVDIPRSRIREALENIHPGEEDEKAGWAVKVLRLIDNRTGLIRAMQQRRMYQFTHRTFQEYLAARWLAGGQFLPKFKAHIDQEQWREAVFLALGYQISVQSEYDNALSVLKNLLPTAPQSELEWRRALLLSEAYVRLLGPQRASEAEGSQVAAEVMTLVPDLLRKALWNKGLPARQRLEAGLLEAALDIDPPGLDDFIPPLDRPSPRGFHIARYPVTNKQFRRFVEAGGYEEDRPWWTEEITRELAWDEGWRKGPRYWDDERFNHSTQPVVGISWYEANAYCRWLTEELRAAEAIDREQEARLPTQEEWMQAAGNRTYPWGPEFDPARANTEESDLGQTTPVHMYADGKTPEGVWDLAGNVWEWMMEETYLKGGSWLFDKDRAKSAARYGVDPDLRSDHYGFRVVVVPSSRHS
jgi:energy-coupling factor transporter ATP-binding protein EcfA2